MLDHHVFLHYPGGGSSFALDVDRSYISGAGVASARTWLLPLHQGWSQVGLHIYYHGYKLTFLCGIKLLLPDSKTVVWK